MLNKNIFKKIIDNKLQALRLDFINIYKAM